MEEENKENKVEEKEEVYTKIIKETEKLINTIIDEEIQPDNLEDLYKLVDIYKDAKEVESMYGNYGNYGNYGGNYGANYGANYGGNYGGNYGHNSNYGEYGANSYGVRGRDKKYRGEEEMDRMVGEYGKYQESRSRYGTGEEIDKSFHYMVKALEDFIKVLGEEAETPQQKQQLMQALQNSMR